MTGTFVFFRNDDVNRIEPGLVEVTDLLNSHGAPVSHAVEPANLDDQCRDFLLSRPDDQVEIIQHGYAHVKHDLGEFGGRRSRQDQFEDLRAGLRIMEESFGARFFRAMSFPYGSYNDYTVPLLEGLGYPVVSCHRRHQFSRQVFYGTGRILGKGRWMGRHVSHHLRPYPGTNVREISVSISPIARYFPDIGPKSCEFHSLDYLKEMFQTCRRQSWVVGVVLHHRFRDTQEALDDLDGFVGWLKDQPDVVFSSIRTVWETLESRS